MTEAVGSVLRGAGRADPIPDGAALFNKFRACLSVCAFLEPERFSDLISRTAIGYESVIIEEGKR